MRSTCSFLFLCTLVVCVGCGSSAIKTEPVTGIVTLDGKPVEAAFVTFIPKEQGEGATVSFGTSDATGRYSLQVMRGDPDAGTTPGEYRVTVEKIESVPTGRKFFNESAGQMEEETKPVDRLPLLYKNRDKTPLSATVVPGKNEINLELISR